MHILHYKCILIPSQFNNMKSYQKKKKVAISVDTSTCSLVILAQFPSLLIWNCSLRNRLFRLYRANFNSLKSIPTNNDYLNVYIPIYCLMLLLKFIILRNEYFFANKYSYIINKVIYLYLYKFRKYIESLLWASNLSEFSFENIKETLKKMNQFMQLTGTEWT